MLKKIIIVILFIGSLASCNILNKPQDQRETELVISAASSLTDALNELKKEYEVKNPNVKLTFNFASSGKLVYQIEQGATVDVFLSASTFYMDQAENKNLIEEDSRFSFATNEMVLVTNRESAINITSFDQLRPEEINMLAIGNPDSVPAGEYAREILQYLGLWRDIEDNVVYAKDVRQVLAYVESGNADYGIVYSSDAVISENIKIIATASPEWHNNIEYPAAIIKDSKHKVEAKHFLDYINSSEGKAILNKYGFK